MKTIAFLSLCATLLLNTGCSSMMKSSYQPPTVTYPAQWQEPVETGAPVPFRWQDFHDPQLEQWLQQVLASNNDLAIAVLRLYHAQLESELTGIKTAPAVSAGLAMNGQKVLQDASPWSKSSSASLQVSYEVDLWGKLARQRDAAEWARQATAQDLATARLTLLTEASKNYWQIAWLNQRIAVSTQSIAYAKETLALVNARYRAGKVAVLDVVDAEQSLVNQESNHLALLRQRKQALNIQTVLLGALPGDVMVEPQHLPTGSLPQISADIPALALARRPDINALELRLREALANVDITRAQYYPAFTLTSTIGSSSDALLEFVRNPVAMLGAGLTLPFVQWRQRDIEVKIARNDYEQRVLEFKQALYKAMAGINDALSLWAQLKAQEKQLQQGLALAYKSERLNEIRYREGATPINFFLDAQERRRLAQVALDTNRYEQMQNLALIYLEFGGDQYPGYPLCQPTCRVTF